MSIGRSARSFSEAHLDLWSPPTAWLLRAFTNSSKLRGKTKAAVSAFQAPSRPRHRLSFLGSSCLSRRKLERCQRHCPEQRDDKKAKCRPAAGHEWDGSGESPFFFFRACLLCVCVFLNRSNNGKQSAATFFVLALSCLSRRILK